MSEEVTAKTKRNKNKRKSTPKSLDTYASQLRSSVDMFGMGVSFKIGDEGQFTTWAGTLLSLMIYALILAYGSYKFVGLVNRDDAVIRTSSVINGVPLDTEWGQPEGFKVAVAISNIGRTADLFDEEYLSLDAYWVEKEAAGKKPNFTHMPL